MNLKPTLTSIRVLSIKSLILLSLISSTLHAQRHHDHPAQGNGGVELSAEILPDSDDRAFVNFHVKQIMDPKGYHGMLFFGSGETFYISHLPMFHKPHDYQVIVEVRLSSESRKKYLKSLEKNGGYFTFAPEGNFVLPEVVIRKMKIKGTLVQGHFERGGKELLSDELELIRVVYYKKISAKDKNPKRERYVLFGKEKEYFLAHEIFAQPNFDEIIPLPKDFALPAALKEFVKESGVVFLDDVEIKDQTVFFKELKKGFPYKEFYRETGDLQ